MRRPTSARYRSGALRESDRPARSHGLAHQKTKTPIHRGTPQHQPLPFFAMLPLRLRLRSTNAHHVTASCSFRLRSFELRRDKPGGQESAAPCSTRFAGSTPCGMIEGATSGPLCLGQGLSSSPPALPRFACAACRSCSGSSFASSP